MKIAQVVCTYPPYRGGIANVAKDYAEAIKKGGHDVSVFCPSYSKVKYSSDVKVFRLRPFLKYGNSAFIPQLFYYLLRGNFDIIHLHYPFFGGMEIVWLFKKIFKHKIKLIIHYHMNVVGLPWYLEIMRLPSRSINNSLFKIADAVSCASIDYIKSNDIGGIYNKNKDKFFEIPFGVDVGKFKPGSDKKKQILFVGGMDKAHYFKGVDILLQAFAELKRQDLKLILIGNGDLVIKYKELANNLKINKLCTFIEGLNDEQLIKYYQESSVLILPSINNCEAFGIVLLEAMACGTSVIASSLPGVRTVFNDGVEGFYFKTGNYFELSKKIKLLLDDNEKLEIMSRAARELTLSRYDINVTNKRLLEICKNVL